ncbi:MAG: hypothetical protein A4E19_13095 [Nitrospira sp. SG-bin1]|nr:MAG: hypothetical protein A4E19_13095 [Nitrospira sp. SG-bin1]
MECFGHGTWIVRCHAQQAKGRAVRHATSLLPVTQGCDAAPNHEGKLGLRRVKLFADAFHISRPKRSDARRLHMVFQMSEGGIEPRFASLGGGVGSFILAAEESHPTLPPNNRTHT